MASRPGQKVEKLLASQRRRVWHSGFVPTPVIDDPILNSPFTEPTRHWVLDENGIPAGFSTNGRRRSEFVVPVPPPKHKTKAQAALDLEDEYGNRLPNDAINQVRTRVAA